MGAYGNTPEAECKGWLNIPGYGVVSKTRAGRTLFEYQLNLRIRNASSVAATGVTATLLSMPSNVTIIDNQVDVGAIAAGATVTSSDTFTIRVDRSVLLSALPISWQVTYSKGGRTGRDTLVGTITPGALEPNPVPHEQAPIPAEMPDTAVPEAAPAQDGGPSAANIGISDALVTPT